MNGCALKAKLAQLIHLYHVRPLERAPIPLRPPTAGPQIIEGYAATPDVDADRMSFKRGSLTWPADLGKLPLLVRHDSSKIAGKLLAVDYDAGGRLFVRARVDDPEARCMGGFSIAATVVESEVRDEDSPTGFHFVITRATVDEISLTPIPANACALVTSRRDVGPIDDRHDEVMASLGRFGKGLEQLQAALSVPAPSEPAKARDTKHLTIGAGAAHIYGTLPRAILQRRKTPFSALVAHLGSPPG